MATKGFFATLSIGASITAQVPKIPDPPKADSDYIGVGMWNSTSPMKGPDNSGYEGLLLRGHGLAPVYKVENGVKRWIVTEQVFLKKRFLWEDVHIVPKYVLDGIPDGKDIT